MFKVGDRVQVTEKWAQDSPENEYQIGWLGTVTEINDGQAWPIRVRMDKQTESFDWHMWEDEIELVSGR